MRQPLPMLHAFADVAVGEDLHVLTYRRTFGDVGEGADVHIVRELGARVHEAGLLDAHHVETLRFMDLQQARKGRARVVHTHERKVLGNGFGRLKIAGYDHHAGRGFVHMLGVHRVGQERQGAGAAFFDLGHVMHQHLRVAIHFPMEEFCDLSCGELHALVRPVVAEVGPRR
jgi:hypothetical protein